ncbi:MAG: carboxypeptidase regulatory-like domain-containing protein [Candidatus Acidiferrales bacterium]
MSHQIGRSRVLQFALVVVAGILLFINVAAAQTGTASIVGTVTDPNGAVVPGAKLTIKNVDTNHVFTIASDSAGAYVAAGLAPGNYELRAENAGFVTEVRKGITLTVAQVAQINFSLKIGSMSQQVVVQGGAPLLETVTSSVSGLVNEEQMEGLPLNGRDISQLVLLQAGVTPTPSAGPSPFQKGGFAKFSVNGQRSTATNYTIDGMDANDPDYALSPGGVSGELLGVDGIREFRVFTNDYNAEYGRNAGAIVQMITKSGQNTMHGSLFEFLRNDAFDAKNFFDLPNEPIPPFVRNQFGASFGAPIVKDKTFFFADYEGFRESEGLTNIATVPDALAHEGYLPNPSSPAACTQSNLGGCVNVGVNPAVAPFLAIFPAANGTDFGNGSAELTSSERRKTREDYGMVRVDHIFSNNHSAFARYIIDDSDALVPYLSTLAPGFPGNNTSRNQYFTAQDQELFGSNWLNQASFGFNRTTYLASVQNLYPSLSISLVPNRPIGVFSLAGLTPIGNNLIYPLADYSNVFQLDDNVSWTHGHHSIRFGGEFRRDEINGPFDLFVNGEYVFEDLSAFGIPSLSNNPSIENFLRGIPLVYVGVTPAGSNSDRGFRQFNLGGYVQDDWTVMRSLTLNLGIRYEFNSNPTEAQGKESNIINVATDTAPEVGKLMNSTPKDLFAPRFGFAWKVGSDNKTVVRGGFGLFYDQIWGNIYGNSRSLPPYYQAVENIFPEFLNPTVAAVSGTTANATLTYFPKWPQVMQYNLNVQREVFANSVLTIGYIGTRGNHLGRLGEANPNEFATGMRLNPNFGSIERYVTDAQSFYNALQVTFEHRFSHGLTGQANYNYGHSVDDASGYNPSDAVNETGASQNFFDRTADRGRSGFDIRHSLTLNALYDLPIGPGKAIGNGATGFAGKLIGGWELSGIGNFHSNVPFTPVLGFDNADTQSIVNSQRPDIIGNPNVGTCPNGSPVHTVACWFNPSAFAVSAPGTFGDAGRNILSGPDFAELDLAIIKNTKLTEKTALEFRAEFFNIANHPNFAVPTNTVGPNGSGGNGDAIFLGPTALAGNAGQIFSTVGSSRQIQFGLRLSF